MRVFVNGKEVKAGFKPSQRRGEDGKWTNEPDPKHEFDMYGRPAWEYSLRQYSKDSFRLNQQIRDNEYIYERWLMDRVDYALTRLPKYKGKTYRGMRLFGHDLDLFLDEIESGELIFKSFTSSSKSIDFADDFNFYGKGTKFLLNMTGKSGRDISKFASINMQDMEEVLFPRNTKWKVDDFNEWIDENTGELYYNINLTEK